MRLVIFGLTVSSSWGNGHATLWRGLCRSLARRGREITFFERDVPYYASHRDRSDPEGASLVLSYAGGPALRELSDRLGARRVEALYGSVDPDVHHTADHRALELVDIPGRDAPVEAGT